MNEYVLPRFDGNSQQAPVAGIGALKTEHGNLPLAALGYHSTVESLTVKTEITQTFYNPFDEAIEANYIFPLEGTLAVTDCLMIVGDRVIRADLQERSAARRRYQQAIRNGHRAALLEENRSETFSLAVGNIPPGEAIRIRLVTVGQLPVFSSTWTLRLPLVVAPRYTSGWSLPRTSSGGGTHLDTSSAPDASHVTPPVLLPVSIPGFANPVQLSLSVEVDLESLAPVVPWNQHLESSLHSVVVAEDKHRATVRIHPGEKVDRDFILRGSIASEQLTTYARLAPPTEASRGTFAINLVPPAKPKTSALGRDVIFVLDRSGSMRGWKYTAAQRGISRLIDTLTDQDRFGVIVFDDRTDIYQPSNESGLVQANDKNRFAATKWLNRLKIRGGTEMEKAIEAALGMATCDQESTTKSSVVLVTDGQITAEDAVMARLRGILPQRCPRIYTLGVDRAVNASVLRRLSTATGGTFELVESETKLDTSLKRLGREIGSPVLSNLKLIVDEECETVFGGTDLYANRPVTIYGRTTRQDLSVQLTAIDSSGNTWQRDVRVHANGHAASDALVSLWGRGRVRMLEDQYAIGGVDDPQARAAIVATSLESHVLSRFTAYVAVDESEVVNLTGEVVRATQPVEFPEGWAEISFTTIPAEHLINPHAPIVEVEPGSESKTEPKFDFAKRTGRTTASQQRDRPEVELNQVGEKLVQQGIMSQEQWDDARQRESKLNSNSLNHAMELGYVTAREIAQVTAQVYKVPFVDLETADVPEHVVHLMPEAVARENLVFPVGEYEGGLVIATTDLGNVDTIEKLRFILNRDIKVVSATRDSIKKVINQRYGQIEGESADSILQEFTDTVIDFTTIADDDCTLESAQLSDLEYDAFNNNPFGFASSAAGNDFGYFGVPAAAAMEAAVPRKKRIRSTVPLPIQRLIELMIQEAVDLGASEILLRLTGDCVTIEYFIDGVWHQRDRLPLRQWSYIINGLKHCTSDVPMQITFPSEKEIRIEFVR